MRLAILTLTTSLVLVACTPAIGQAPTATAIPVTPVVALAPEAPTATAPPVLPTQPPAPTPTNLPRPTQAPDPLVVTGTGPEGLSLRPVPGSTERLAVLPEGTRLVPTGEEQQVGGRTWRKVRTPQGQEGWVAAEFIGPANTIAAPPPPTTPPTSAPPPTQAAKPTTPPATAAPKPVAPLVGPTPAPKPAATAPPAPKPAAPTAVAKPTAPPAIAKPAAGRCDPSYPDVCIPPYPPDLDCGDIPYRRFRVLRPDPHGFDRDRDGIGCES